MNYNAEYSKPTIDFDRTSQYNYDVHYNRKVLIGTLSMKGKSWVFYPVDLDGLSLGTMKVICEKIEWLDSRITVGDRVY